MKRVLPLVAVMAVLGFAATSWAANPVVEIDTSMGKIKVELDEEKAPITVKNFLMYVEDKHYDGTVFHRVIPDFMIQGGGYKGGISTATKPDEVKKLEKDTKKPIQNEAGNGLSNKSGTIAMARTDDPDSATAQFFINVEDNSGGLDRKGDKAGYAVFGKVIDGMDVVNKIKAVKTKTLFPGFRDVPVEDVVIKSIRRVEK